MFVKNGSKYMLIFSVLGIKNLTTRITISLIQWPLEHLQLDNSHMTSQHVGNIIHLPDFLCEWNMPAIQDAGQDTCTSHQNSSSPSLNVPTSSCVSGDFQHPTAGFLHHFCKERY
jgi:hypothetical protein